MNLTEDQILSLAPDDASRKAGKDLSSPKKWVSKGATALALWGECQGSGSKPYQTQVDLSAIAFKCSCPSRKFPCKHGLGLLLYKAGHPNDFNAAAMPPWVEEWINKRGQKQQAEAAVNTAPKDEASREKRQKARESKVEDGIEQLLRWLKDLVRIGLLDIPAKGTAFFDAMARRMVDAQAPGLAAMVRSLGNTPFYKEGWQAEFLHHLARIYLAVSGMRNINAAIVGYPVEDIRTRIGFPQNQEELKEQQGLEDTWLILGKQVSEEEGLTTEKNWLYGINSGKYALVLQFIFRGQGLQFSLSPGMFITAELVFFPSAEPLRALIKKQVSVGGDYLIHGLQGWNEAITVQANAGMRQPFLEEQPMVVQNLVPLILNNEWWLKDASGKMMPVAKEFSSAWKLLAASGGMPLNMALVGTNNSFTPLGIWLQNKYNPL